LFSGDKLLGGPQAGILAGKKEGIQKVEKDPLMRAFRLDKMTLAALETTLRLYLNEERAPRQGPGLRMLGTPAEELRQRAQGRAVEELRQRAEGMAARLREVEGVARAEPAEDVAFVGGGSLPDQAMKTWVVEVEARGRGDADLAYRLRTGHPAVMGRVRAGKLGLDLRTVFPVHEDAPGGAARRG